jgi:hypothetical protein
MAPARTCELSVNAQEVNCVVVAMDHGFAASRLALLDRHLERVCREGGGRVLADRPADHTAAERVEHDGAVDLPSRVGCSVMRRFTPEATRRRG